MIINAAIVGLARRRIDRFCRALAFHPERNPIGDPAAELNGLSVHVGAATPCDASGASRVARSSMSPTTTSK